MKKKNVNFIDPRRIKKIRKTELQAYDNEISDIKRQLVGLQHNLVDLIRNLKPVVSDFDTARKFNKGVVENQYILEFLSKYGLSASLHDELKKLISANLYNRITQKQLGEKFRSKIENLLRKKFIAEARGDLFPDFVYRYLPTNLSVTHKDGLFEGIRHHYNNEVNSVARKMYVSACLEPEFKNLYNSMYDKFQNPATETEKMYSCLALITMLTGIRPGVKVGTITFYENEEALEKNTFGLTTLTKDHLFFEGDICRFDFDGKKGTFNTFTISEPNIVAYLKDLYDRDLIFKVANESVSYEEFFKFLRKQTGFGPSDYRKRASNVSLFSNLKEYSGESVQDFLEEVFSKVAVDLNHKSTEGGVAINSYCNPRIVLRWLSKENMETLEEAVSETPFKVGFRR
jgi:hypothetical protein